ncbi:MAG: AraC family transcriptional regulator [Lachnospiraceae bacterium]|nr:AraC family transcriptional regulator [Lachnospiraceae bacterium]
MEKENILGFSDKKAGNLVASSCGICTAEPLEKYGPAIKPYYLFLYVFKGSGVLTMGGKKFKLGKGDGALVFPNELASYQAEKNDPWSHAFISFNGENADEIIRSIGLTVKKPVFKSKKIDEIQQIVKEMMANSTFDISAEMRRNGYFSVFMSLVANGSTPPSKSKADRIENYVSKAVDFIKSNYCDPIKITDVAEYVCINRSYLYTLFMSTLDVSPHQFLSDYRISKACELLETTNTSIESVALSCGYMDSLVFTKAFKQVKGLSPSIYRKAARAEKA